MSKESREITLAEASSRYLATLSDEERQKAHAEVGKFVRWYGPDRLMSEMRPPEIGNYAESLGASVTDPTKRLEPVRNFLSYAKKEGFTSTNLAPHLRVSKTSKGRAQERTIESGPVHLTAAGIERLKTELAGLKEQRVHVAQALRHAMADKDFRENAPLDAAREQQGQLEARIRKLEGTLKNAIIIENEKKDSAKVELGSTVVLRDLESQEEVSYSLVNPNEANLSKGKISISSPTGRALVEREAGDTVEVTAPMGKIRYRIEKVS